MLLVSLSGSIRVSSKVDDAADTGEGMMPPRGPMHRNPAPAVLAVEPDSILTRDLAVSLQTHVWSLDSAGLNFWEFPVEPIFGRQM